MCLIVPKQTPLFQQRGRVVKAPFFKSHCTKKKHMKSFLFYIKTIESYKLKSSDNDNIAHTNIDQKFYCYTPCLVLVQQKKRWNKVGLTLSQCKQTCFKTDE